MNTDTTANTSASPQAIDTLPKIELHVHLEGTIEPERIAALAAAAGAELPRPLERIYEAADLSEFLQFLDWVGSLVTTPEIAADLAYEFAQRAHRDNTIYAEVIVNPTHWPALELPDLLAGIAAGFDKAQRDGLPDCRILPSILRQQSAESAEALVAHLVEHRPDRVVGLSIDGNEEVAGRTAERFEQAYATAKAAGFGLTAHAGESSGPDGVIDALDVLHVDRIDHGIRAIEDPELIARLAEEGQALNVCVTSNCRRMYPDVEHHPILGLLAAGVTCTINTDDPAPMECSLTEEFAMVAGAAGLDADALAGITRNAITASFCDDATKSGLTSTLDAWVAAAPQ